MKAPEVEQVQTKMDSMAQTRLAPELTEVTEVLEQLMTSPESQ